MELGCVGKPGGPNADGAPAGLETGIAGRGTDKGGAAARFSIASIRSAMPCTASRTWARVGAFARAVDVPAPAAPAFDLAPVAFAFAVATGN
eukprot:4650643-Amphidinium_carterae.1